MKNPHIYCVFNKCIIYTLIHIYTCIGLSVRCTSNLATTNSAPSQERVREGHASVVTGGVPLTQGRRPQHHQDGPGETLFPDQKVVILQKGSDHSSSKTRTQLWASIANHKTGRASHTVQGTQMEPPLRRRTSTSPSHGTPTTF